MARYRSILSLILVIVATLIVSCGGPTVATVAQTYTDAQLEQIQRYVPEITALRGRMNQIPALIQRRDWMDVSDFIHGPLGEMRMQMTYVTRHLLPKDQEAARQATRDLFDHLVKIEQAAQVDNSQGARLNYREALGDIDTFLQLVPQPSIEQPGSEA